MRPLLPAYSSSVVLVVLSSLMFLLDPLLMKWLIDRVLPKKDFRLLVFAARGFFVLYIFRLGFFTLAQLVNFRTIQKLVLRMRLSILEHPMGGTHRGAREATRCRAAKGNAWPWPVRCSKIP